MCDDTFDVEDWLRRIGHTGSRNPTLATLRAVIVAHATSIPYETVDILLGRVPKLDLASIQRKLVKGGRGGYCFEQNLLLRAGLQALGFTVASLSGRAVRGAAADAPRRALHMALRVDLPEGPFLADVGFGNITPTWPLLLYPGEPQETPHGRMRLIPVAEEMVLQAWLDEGWQNIFRLSPRETLDVDYEVANWFTSTNPESIFVSNLVVACAGPDGTRRTLLNSRFSVRRLNRGVERHVLTSVAEYRTVLADIFDIRLDEADLVAVLAALDRHGTREVTQMLFS